MNAFESLVGCILERDGYWVKFDYKVELTKEEKRAIGRHSSPRWEIDIVAYKAGTNELRVVECKSYIDSPGVRFKGFDGSDPKEAKRYKLFNEAKLREIVLHRVAAQLEDSGSCKPNPKVSLCLAAGRVAGNRDRERLREYFQRQDWLFWDEEWIRSALVKVSKSGYEDDVAAVVTKLLLRKPDTRK